MERAASRQFGFMAYAAHLNGFTRRGGLIHTWVGRRANDKAIDPGMLDNLVGGRIAAGYTVDETMRKEAWEEAGITPALLEALYCVGAVRVEYTVPEGLHREILFVHDLWLPQDFTPRNQDGEVSEIQMMRNEDVVERILDGEFTLDAGAVMIDGLIRQGIPSPEDPQYLDILRLLETLSHRTLRDVLVTRGAGTIWQDFRNTTRDDPVHWRTGNENQAPSHRGLGPCPLRLRRRPDLAEWRAGGVRRAGHGDDVLLEALAHRVGRQPGVQLGSRARATPASRLLPAPSARPASPRARATRGVATTASGWWPSPPSSAAAYRLI